MLPQVSNLRLRERVTCPTSASDLAAKTKFKPRPLIPALGSGLSTLTSPESEFHYKTAFINILFYEWQYRVGVFTL